MNSEWMMAEGETATGGAEGVKGSRKLSGKRTSAGQSLERTGKPF